MENEKRLIDANALFDELIKRQYSEQTMGIVASYYPQMRAVLANAPTVDAVEVVHGRWIDVALRYTEVKEECSVCHGVVRVHGFRFCPNCGAKMDGDGNGAAQV